jgi:hypothetical protein
VTAAAPAANPNAGLSRATVRNVCTIEHDAGVKRVRAWGWFPVWDAAGQRDALAHASYLRDLGFKVWIDHYMQPATSIEDPEGRQMDYKPRAAAVKPPAPPVLRVPVSIPVQPRPPKFAPDDPPLRVVAPGIHTAGEQTKDGHQFCTHCGGLLATFTVGMPAVPTTRYPVGASIHRGAAGWQAGMIGTVPPTCAQQDERTA